MRIENGILLDGKYIPSQHHNSRPPGTDVSLLVIHNISLPPGQFGGPYIEHLFTGCLNPNDHPFFEQIHQLEVSAHFLIRRDGEIFQFVPLDLRAWHAGLSSFQGQGNCNDFSIGIELEGTDEMPYSDVQYSALLELSHEIMKTYPSITLGRVVGHMDIAPKRKTDPGFAFDWGAFRAQLAKKLTHSSTPQDKEL